MNTCRRILTRGLVPIAVMWTPGLPTARGEPPTAGAGLVAEAEQERIDTIARVMPSVVCVFNEMQESGGSGVIIAPDGIGLTNFHVIAGMMRTRRGYGGLSDGQLYELRVLGIDPTGDVAMFRLRGQDRFAFAELGDSDQVRVGDRAMVMGNPFLLAEDYAPSVSTGIVTGVHRYQAGKGNKLIYTDCLQTDAAVNPGNSGGPLLDAAGRVIGINGRISVNVRGRYNVGFGYAISINQIRRFIPALRAGRLVRHGTLQATVNEDRGFAELRRSGPAYRAGVRPGDELLALGGQTITSANHFASLLGVYPENWPVALCWKRGDEVFNRIVRLDALALDLRHRPQPLVGPRRTALIDVLRRFNKAVRTAGPVPIAWRWWALRRSAEHREDSATVRIQAAEAGPERGTHEHYVADVTEPLRRVVYAAEGVWQVEDSTADVNTTPTDAAHSIANSGGDSAPPAVRHDLPADRAMVLDALHTLRWKLLGEPVLNMKKDWDHAGGDELLRIDDHGNVVESRLLEGVSVPLAQHASAVYQFDVQTDLLRRIIVHDHPRDTQATILLDDYADVGGLRWPRRVTVTLPSGRYLEEWTDIDISFE